jgi:hypothetical protein
MQSISTETIVNSQEELEPLSDSVDVNGAGRPAETGMIRSLWKIWHKRQLLTKVGGRALIVSTLLVFLIPNKFE